MAAAAVFIWHFQTRQAIGSEDGTILVTSAFLIVLALMAVFAVAKVVLSSHTFIDRTALQLLALAMLVAAWLPPGQQDRGAFAPVRQPTQYPCRVFHSGVRRPPTTNRPPAFRHRQRQRHALAARSRRPECIRGIGER